MDIRKHMFHNWFHYVDGIKESLGGIFLIIKRYYQFTFFYCDSRISDNSVGIFDQELSKLFFIWSTLFWKSSIFFTQNLMSQVHFVTVKNYVTEDEVKIIRKLEVTALKSSKKASCSKVYYTLPLMSHSPRIFQNQIYFVYITVHR